MATEEPKVRWRQRLFALRRAWARGPVALRALAVLVVAAALASMYVVAVLNGSLSPDVRGKMMVLYCRSAMPFSGSAHAQGGRSGMSRWAGMFSEFTSVLGALRYAELHGAAGVRVHFTSDMYADEEGDNWWAYFFQPVMLVRPTTAHVPEVHFNGWLAKYGRFGGFGSFVYGGDDTRPWYPAKSPIPRAEVHRLLTQRIRVLPHVREVVDKFRSQRLAEVDYVIAVHYRGTDTRFHYPFFSIPYELMLAEVQRVLDQVRPATYRVFVATDETEFLEWVTNHPVHGPHVVYYEGSPRVRRDEDAVHFNEKATRSKYQKGESAIVDCLLLASADYLVKTRSSISDTSVPWNLDMNYTFVLGPTELLRVGAHQ